MDAHLYLALVLSLVAAILSSVPDEMRGAELHNFVALISQLQAAYGTAAAAAAGTDCEYAELGCQP